MKLKAIQEPFYQYEGKLATTPIIEFLAKNKTLVKGIMLDIGCGNQPYRNNFDNVDHYIGLDINIRNKKADIIADGSSLPLLNKSIDAVLCSQVIEHSPEPDLLVREIARVLKEGGILLLSAPQMGRLHGEPHDYWRYTKWGLKCILQRNGLRISVIETHGGIFRALGSHLNFFAAECSKNRAVLLIIKFNNCFFELLDKYFTWEKDTLGYNVIAVKPSGDPL